jgi:exopolysaccharide biosynthesis polyprenyl glycosylphosphotransferase
MLPRRQEINTQIQQILDVALLAGSFWLAHQLRWRGTVWFNLDSAILPFEKYAWTLVALLPFAPLILEAQGFYQTPLLKSWSKSVIQLLRSMLWMGLLVAGCVIFLRLELPSRSVLILFAVLGSAILLLKERIYYAWLRARIAGGELKDNVLFVGSNADIDALLATLTPDQVLRWNIAAKLDLDSQSVPELADALHKHNIDLVVFAAGHTQLHKIEEAVNACEIEGVEAWLMADFIRTSIAKPTLDSLGGRIIIAFRSTPDLSWSLLVKDIIDRTGALFGLLIASPLFLFAAIGVRLSSPGPIFFKQNRSGRHGRPFLMFKFRTMTTDAEMRKEELEKMNQMTGPVFKIDRDPRVTPIGRWLRKTSLDELPQLVNVLMGQMSLVGPRPLPIYETERFEDMAHRRRLSMKPGLTCLWQISGRNIVTDFREWVKLDLEYIDNWSLWLDLKILFRTIPVVVMGIGAR